MIASAKEIDALNITLFNSCINFTNVHLCNYCTKIFVIVVNTCVCRRSVDNKALILSFPYKGLRRVKGGYKGLQRVTRVYKGLLGDTGGYRGLKGITRGYKGLQGVTVSTRGYKKLQRSTRGYNV